MPTSFDNYAPFDSGIGSNAMEDLWRKMMQHNHGDGVLAANVLPESANEMSCYADNTGMQVKVRIGQVWLKGHWGESTSEKTLPISAAHATLARIDRVIVRAVYTTGSTPGRIELDVITGTAAASPVAPPMVTNSSKCEIPVAQVVVSAAASSITADKVADERQRVGWGMFTDSFVPPLYYEGAHESLGATSVNMGTGAVRKCTYSQLGKIVQIRYEFTWGTGPYNGGTGRIYTTLPPGMVATDTYAEPGGTDHRIPAHLWTATGGPDWLGTALVSPGDTRVWPFFSVSATNSRIAWYRIAGHPGGGAGTGTPFISGGWPEGGQLIINGLLEIQ